MGAASNHHVRTKLPPLSRIDAPAGRRVTIGPTGLFSRQQEPQVGTERGAVRKGEGMHTLRLVALLPLALGLLAGCQSPAPSAKPPTGANAAATPVPASTNANAPTSAANPSRPLIAVVDDRTPSTLRLIT